MRQEFSLLYTFIFMGLGVLAPLIGAHLDQAGFTGDQIGIITASGTFVAVFAAPFWGYRYASIESASRRYYLVAAIFIAAALTALCLPGLRSFVIFLLAFILLYVFQSPSVSLMDALTIDVGEDFGLIRTFGALGFALSCFSAAFLADRTGTFVIFPIYAGCFLIGAAIVLLIRRSSGAAGKNEGSGAAVKAGTGNSAAEKSPAAERISAAEDRASSPARGRQMYRQLLSNRAYVLIVLCAFFINGTDNANNTYFNFLYLDGGGTLTGVGIAFLLMAGSEAPFMAASTWLCQRFGQDRILLIAIVFSVVRFGLFSLGLPAPVLIALFPLQGLVNGITLVEYVKYVARVIPSELSGIGIAVYYAIGSSFSTIVCQLIGGHLLDHPLLTFSGPQSVYLFFAVFNIAGVLIFQFGCRRA
ncbi:MAG: MFS transporter [Firmicutes bacterium]|nr:MFS transporter [Bacillota bacterium]